MPQMLATSRRPSPLRRPTRNPPSAVEEAAQPRALLGPHPGGHAPGDAEIDPAAGRLRRRGGARGRHRGDLGDGLHGVPLGLLRGVGLGRLRGALGLLLEVLLRLGAVLVPALDPRDVQRGIGRPGRSLLVRRRDSRGGGSGGLLGHLVGHLAVREHDGVGGTHLAAAAGRGQGDLADGGEQGAHEAHAAGGAELLVGPVALVGEGAAQLDLVELVEVDDAEAQVGLVVAAVVRVAEEGLELLAQGLDVLERGAEVHGERERLAVGVGARHVLDALLAQPLVGDLEVRVGVDAPEHGVQQGLALHHQGLRAGRGKVPHLDAVADVEGVVEEDEDHAREEVVEGPADGEGEADGDEADRLLDLLDGGDVEDQDEEDHDDGEERQADPVQRVETVVDVVHALIDAVPDLPGLDDGINHLVEPQVAALILVQDLEVGLCLLLSEGSEDLGDVLRGEALLSELDQ